MVSIQGAVDDEVLKRISEVLDTAALTVYASDEIRLGFSYRRFERGRSIRALDYEDRQRPDDRGAWTRVDGERESWEILLFSERLKDLYLRYAPDEVADGCRGDTIHLGHSIPWACDGKIVGEIVDRLQLPWRPLESDFPPAAQTEMIPGSPDRWRRFHRSVRKPWWKLW